MRGGATVWAKPRSGSSTFGHHATGQRGSIRDWVSRQHLSQRLRTSCEENVHGLSLGKKMGAGRLRSHKTLSPTGTCQYVVTLAPQRSVELSGLVALGTTRWASLPRPLQERPRSLVHYKMGLVASSTTRWASLPRPLQERPRSLVHYKKGLVASSTTRWAS
jgi:hypothetical protein